MASEQVQGDGNSAGKDEKKALEVEGTQGGTKPGRAKKPYQTKVVLIGEASVGKSCFVSRFLKGQGEKSEPTIGAAFFTQKVELDGNVIKYDIWDTAGQERFHSLTPMYYRNATAVIIAYDITKSDTFERAKSWAYDVETRSNPDVLLTLIGTKRDLVVTDEDRQVDTEVAKKYADSINASFFETSSVTGLNVSEVFSDIGKRVISLEVPQARQRGEHSQQYNLGQGQNGGGSNGFRRGSHPSTTQWDNHNPSDRSGLNMKKWVCCNFV